MKRFNAIRLPLVRAVSAASFSLALSGCLSGAVCGDGLIGSNEICDDGNGDGDDFCTNECKIGPLVAVEGFVQKEVDSTDILLVVDDSGSMSQEHINFMAQLQKIIGDLSNAGTPLRFATVTSDADNNPSGSFFTTPGDIINGGGIIRDVPNLSGINDHGGFDDNNFCNEVIAASDGGVLASDNLALNNLLASHGPIPDFTGRIAGFQDVNGDSVADNLIAPSFTDAVGCLLAVGVRGSGQEVALCQAVSALDPASLASSNHAFLQTPNSVLGIVVISDEDDSTLSISDTSGEVRCHPFSLINSPIGGLITTQSVEEENICGTGISGQFENLAPTQGFVDRIKALRDEEHLYVATIAGPPAPSVANCEFLFPEPSCVSGSTGNASAGNRYFEFVSQFANRSDAFESSICGDPNQVFSTVRKTLVKTVDFDCLETDLNAVFGGSFDIATNLKVRLDLSGTNASCDALGAIASDASGECLLSASATVLNAKTSCGGGFELDTTNLALPNGTQVTVEFRK
jgi:hypothetical protein